MHCYGNTLTSRHWPNKNEINCGTKAMLDLKNGKRPLFLDLLLIPRSYYNPADLRHWLTGIMGTHDDFMMKKGRFT
jgi:hypothetical protein